MPDGKPKVAEDSSLDRGEAEIASGYYHALSDVLIGAAAIELKRLSDVFKPQAELETVLLVLHSLLRAADSLALTERAVADTIFVLNDDGAKVEWRLSKGR